jgi:hypothetical protein
MESIVWSRGIVGVVLCLVGAVWVAQGTGAMHGSSMSGKSCPEDSHEANDLTSRLQAIEAGLSLM